MNVESVLIPLITALAGLGGVWLGGWLSDRRERNKQHTEFVERRLAELYGPLLSLHKEIRARSELRLKIETTVDAQHMTDLFEAVARDRDLVQRVTDEHIPGLLTMIRDEDKTFADVLMPLYRQMLATFREKMWLAEPETRGYCSALIEFVDVWERILRKAMPREVAPAIGHTEQNLQPFYRHLEEMHDRLRNSLIRK